MFKFGRDELACYLWRMIPADPGPSVVFDLFKSRAHTRKVRPARGRHRQRAPLTRRTLGLKMSHPNRPGAPSFCHRRPGTRMRLAGGPGVPLFPGVVTG